MSGKIDDIYLKNEHKDKIYLINLNSSTKFKIVFNFENQILFFQDL